MRTHATAPARPHSSTPSAAGDPVNGLPTVLDVFSQPISPALCVRLGEAAAGYVSVLGYEGAMSIYFVASYLPTQDPVEQQVDYVVYAPFASQTEAQAFQLTLPPGLFGVFGPYALEPNGFDEGFTNPAQLVVGTLQVTPFSNTPGGPIPTGEPAFEWDGYDAVFMSTAAVEKFVIPYYTTIYGPEFAGEIVSQFNAAPVALMGHLPWTEYQTDDNQSTGGTGGAGGTGGTLSRGTLHHDLLHLPSAPGLQPMELRPPAPWLV